MNGNNDDGRMRAAGREGSGKPLRSAFIRRDNADDSGNEMTSEKYLQTILAKENAPKSPLSSQEQPSMPAMIESALSAAPVALEELASSKNLSPMLAVVDETPIVVEEASPVAAIATEVAPSSIVSMPPAEAQSAVLQTSSALTRDAARLRSIMRASDSTNTRPAAVTVEAPPQVIEAEKVLVQKVIVDSDESAPAMEIPLPSMPVSAAPDRELSVVHDVELEGREPSNESPADPQIVLPAMDREKIVSMESATAGIDSVERMVVEQLHDTTAAMITIVRYPQEVLEASAAERNESDRKLQDATEDVAVELAPARSMPVDAAPVSVPELAETETVNDKDTDEGDQLSRDIPLPTLNPVTPKPIATVPPRKEITEDVQRKATRLRPPEPRVSEVRLPRALRIATSMTAEPVVENKARRSVAIETRLRSTAVEPSAPRPLTGAPMRQSADMRPTASRMANVLTQTASAQSVTPALPEQNLRPAWLEESHPSVMEPAQPRRQKATWSETVVEEPAMTEEPEMKEKGDDSFATEFQQKKNVVFAVTTMTVGVILGLGLYAGGADYISGLFANKHEGIGQARPAAVATAATRENGTESVTERAVDPDAGKRSSSERNVQNGGATSGSIASMNASRDNDQREAVRSDADQAAAAPVHEKKVQSGTNVAHADARHIASTQTKATAKPVKAATALTAVKGAHGTATKNLAAKTEKPAKAATTHAVASTVHATTHDAAKGKKDAVAAKTATGAFTVQVRATKDADEAKRIATKLRAKGVKGVTVVTSESGNGKLYRVRFGSYGSTSDAKLAAGKSGADGAWVVKQH